MNSDPTDTRLLIAGLGNSLLRDDGVGVHAVRLLMSSPPAYTRVAEVGTAILHSLHLFESAPTAIVIDAMQAGRKPGTLSWANLEEMEVGERMASLHELGLQAAMHFLEPCRRPHFYLLGIEPGIIDYGLELSPCLRDVLPQIVDQVRAMAEEILCGSVHP